MIMAENTQKRKEYIKTDRSVVRHSIEISNTKPYNISQMTGKSNTNNKPKK